MIKFGLMIIILAIVSMSFTGCSNGPLMENQRFASNASSKPSGSNGAFQVSIEIASKLELGIGQNNSEKITNTSFEKIFLVFLTSNKNTFKAELPAEAMRELDLNLRERLKFCTLERTSDPKLAVQRDLNLMKNVNETRNRLKEIQINALEGKRRISDEEAWELIEYVGVSAIDLCQALKDEN